ncbi:MAG: ABC transporter ATP-binding protein [Acidobacteriota bacterium]
MVYIKAITLRDVTKVYSAGATGVKALDSVSLDINHGEVMMLVGASGSGKTTLLSIMGCILKPSSGRLMILEEDVTDLKERELPRVRLANIGFVFQSFNLFPALTAGQNVEVVLELKGFKNKEARHLSKALLDQVGLTDKYHAHPSKLSGGQKQRVAIARALAGEPPIILADEPTAALDSTNGRKVIMLLRELAHKRNSAVVIVTHDVRTLEFADRIVRIEDGRVDSEELVTCGEKSTFLEKNH